MKKIISLFLLIVLVIGGIFLYKALTKENIEITSEMAYQGVNKYCHDNYDWSFSNDNPSSMYVTIGEENNDEYQIVFRSYTGSFVNFYVNKTSGLTRIMEKSPIDDTETNTKTINIKDYL